MVDNAPDRRPDVDQLQADQSRADRVPRSVRTVLGEVDPGDLGPVNYHEHFFQVSPLLVGDELTDEDRSTAEASDVRAHGIATVVDATPLGLGRNPAALARLSATSGLRVVATTGVHRPPHYTAGHWLHEASEQHLTAWMLADVQVGMPVEDGPDPVQRTDVRAGVLKVGIGYWQIPPLARRALTAVGEVHRATGSPVMIHTEHCTAAHEVLDLLASLGVPSTSVVLAHVDRVPDPGLHAEIAARGAYLGYDGAARLSAQPESALIDALATLVGHGHGDRILLGGDVARATRYLAYGGMPGMRYLTERFVPRVERRIGSEAVQTILIDNAARWLAPTG